MTKSSAVLFILLFSLLFKLEEPVSDLQTCLNHVTGQQRLHGGNRKCISMEMILRLLQMKGLLRNWLPCADDAELFFWFWILLGSV